MSSREAKYSVVIIRDGELIASYEDVPLYKLLRLVIEYHVDVIAVDNVFELVSSLDELDKLVELIPYNCRIVQVTRQGSEFTSIREISKELFKERVELTPLNTAYLNAIAALKGYGSEIQVFTDKTRIVITKGRSVSQGGMSQERYKRSINAGILQATKEVKKILDDNNFEYDMMVKKTRGGLEKSVFIVYAPRERLHGLVKPIRYKNVKIIVKPFKQSHRVLSNTSTKPLIMGIDPGMTIGVALVDLDGNPVFAKSWRTVDRYEIVSTVSSYGKILIVATDVSNPPELVRKIASLLGAIIYSPDHDISITEKNEVIHEVRTTHGFEIEDSHTRDALAAALKAYGHYKNTILEVKSKIKHIDGVDVYQVISEIIKGRTLSDVLEEIYKKRMQKSPSTIIHDEKTYAKQEAVEKPIYKERIRVLEAMVNKLSKELEEKEDLLRILEVEIRLLKNRKTFDEEYERKISVLEENIAYLKRKLEESRVRINDLEEERKRLMEIILKIGEGEYILIPKINESGKSVLSEVDREKIRKTKCVYTPSIEHLSPELVELIKTIKGYIVTSGDSTVDYKTIRVPIINAQVILDLGEHVVVNKDVEKQSSMIWKDIDQLNYLETRAKIRRLIEEYQKSRGILK
ncbi:MAG: DUF460 domain-containing protein [Thermosphaera sp.]